MSQENGLLHFYYYLNNFAIIKIQCYSCAGSFRSAYGAWLGIPVNFSYEKPSDIDRSSVQIRSEAVKWDTEDGKQLATSLILSEPEQVFGICNALLELDSSRIYVEAATPAGILISTFAACQQLNQRALLHMRPFYVILLSIHRPFRFNYLSIRSDF